MCLSIISTVIIGWLMLLPTPLQRRCCPSSSIPCSFLAPLLSFCHSYMQWLAPPIPPHPEVKLVQPTSVAPPSAGNGNSSIAVAQIDEAGWACCFQPQSTASLAHDQARSQPCTDKG